MVQCSHRPDQKEAPVTAAGSVGLGTMGSTPSARLRARGAARIGAKLAAVLITDGIPG
jgi:hypothetical protein